METVSIEVPQDQQPGGGVSVRKRSPPPRMIESMVSNASSPPASVQRSQKPRRRRIRSELDRLLSDEGTRNMLRGLKKPNNKKPSSNSVFRTRVIENKAVGRGGGHVGRRVFRKPIVVGRKRRNSSVASAPGAKQQAHVQPTQQQQQQTGHGGGGGRGSRGVSRGRSSSPGKGREHVKIDYKYVMISRRGGVAWVTIVHGGNEVKCESGGAGTGEDTGGVDGGGGGGGAGSGMIINRGVDGGWGVKVLHSIDSAVRTLEQDSSISVIVLQNSHSRYFCNGIDLSELVWTGKGGTTGGGRISGVVKAMKSLISTLNSSRKLLVASVSGDCVGFGVMVLPLFDLVYANDKSTFRVHYNRLGQSPEGVALMSALVRGGGAGKITSLLYLNNSLTATEAQQAGLVHEILWPARYQEELAARLQSLSSQGDLVCASKTIVRNYRRTVKITDLNSEFSAIEEQWGSSEFQEIARNVVVAGDYDACFWKRSKVTTTTTTTANAKKTSQQVNGGGGGGSSSSSCGVVNGGGGAG